MSQSPAVDVSVIIPTFNRADYVVDSVRSALDQTFSSKEIIVVDDGSTDDTCERLKVFGSDIKTIFQKNRGPAFARNEGIKASCGHYIAFLDSDDLWLPEKLDLQIELLEESHQPGMVFSDAYRLYEDQTVAEPETEFCRLKPASGWIFKKLFHENFIHTSTVVLRKTCLKEVGCFDGEAHFVPAEDYDLWLRIAARHEVNFVDKPLIKYRDHETNISGKDLINELPQVIAVLEKIIKWDPELAKSLGSLKRDRLTELHFLAGRIFFSKRYFKKSKRHFMSVIRYSPFHVRPYIYFLLSLLGGTREQQRSGEIN